MLEDPATAFAPSMAASALEAVAADYVLPLDAIGRKLHELIMQVNRPFVSAPEQLHLEHAAASGTVNLLADLAKIAKPSTLVCLECGGSLWEICEGRPSRYRCHTGHAYTVKSLKDAFDQSTEEAIWSAIRARQERAVSSRQIVAAGNDEAETLNAQAEKDEAHARKLRTLIEAL